MLPRPDPAEKEKGVSLWSIIKDNVGKDLLRICLPVYFKGVLKTWSTLMKPTSLKREFVSSLKR